MARSRPIVRLGRERREPGLMWANSARPLPAGGVESAVPAGAKPIRWKLPRIKIHLIVAMPLTPWNRVA